MNDTARVWAPSMVLAHSQHPPLEHESQSQNQPYAQHHHHHPDPNLVYQQQQQEQHQQAHNFNMNRPAQFDLGAHNAPLSYPPPPPPGTTRTQSSSSYGQAPQGAPYPPPQPPVPATAAPPPAGPTRRRDGRSSPKPESFYAPNAAELYTHAQMINTQQQSPSPGPDGSNSSANGRDHYPVTRLPPILQVEKQQVTTTATQAASASRRRNEAHFSCPVPGCGSTFTRRFNLRGHLRSHTEERPYVCDWKGCGKGFARQHDCKRHQALHSVKSQANLCPGCKKTFSRLDALNRHLRSEGGSECRQIAEAKAAEAISPGTAPVPGPGPGPAKKRKIEEDLTEWDNGPAAPVVAVAPALKEE